MKVIKIGLFLLLIIVIFFVVFDLYSPNIKELSVGKYTNLNRNIVIKTQTEILSSKKIIAKEVLTKKKIIAGSVKDIAIAKLGELIRTDYFEHTNKNGCDFHCRVKRYQFTYGGRYKLIAENLYRGKKCDVSVAYRLWRKSPEHNKVLNYDADEEYLAVGSSSTYCYIVLVRGILK